MDNQKRNDEKNSRIRGVIYPMAGFYLIYQAFCMFRDMSAASGNPNTFMIFSAIFMGIAGLGIMIFGFWVSYKSYKDTGENEEDK